MLEKQAAIQKNRTNTAQQHTQKIRLMNFEEIHEVIRSCE